MKIVNNYSGEKWIQNIRNGKLQGTYLSQINTVTGKAGLSRQYIGNFCVKQSSQNKDGTYEVQKECPGELDNNFVEKFMKVFDYPGIEEEVITDKYINKLIRDAGINFVENPSILNILDAAIFYKNNNNIFLAINVMYGEEIGKSIEKIITRCNIDKNIINNLIELYYKPDVMDYTNLFIDSKNERSFNSSFGLADFLINRALTKAQK